MGFNSAFKGLIYSVTRFHQDRNSRHTHAQPTIMTYGRIPYKNIRNVHPWNST